MQFWNCNIVKVDAPQAQQKRPREDDGGEPPAKKVKEATEEEKRELAKAIEKAKVFLFSTKWKFRYISRL